MSRAPLTLSREMKIGLIALLMLALLGGWLVMNNRQAAVDTAPPVVDATTQSSHDAGEHPSAGTPTPSEPQAGIPVAPGTANGTSGESVTAPPFPVTDLNGSTPDPTVPTPLPSGINPDTPLLSLNGHNPFRPNKLDAVEGETQASAITASQPAPSSEPSNVTITRPNSSASQINAALANNDRGAIPVAPIPTTSPSRSSSGALPINPIPGTPATTLSVPAPTIPTRTASTPPVTSNGDVPASSAATSTPRRNPTTATAPTPTPTPIRTTPVPVNVPGRTVTIPGGGNGNGNGNGQPSQTSSVPTVPPVTAVREPTVSIPGALQAGNQPAQGSASSTVNQSSDNVVQPNDPQAITDTAASQTAQSELETYVKNHQMVFDAAVLGPVNTAIFRSDKGFIVATAGQPLTDSKVMLKEVTASTATLALGQDTITLQLDKR